MGSTARSQRKLAGDGVDFRNLRVHLQWHTSSNKSMPSNPSQNSSTNQGPWIQIYEPVWGPFAFKPQFSHGRIRALLQIRVNKHSFFFFDGPKADYHGAFFFTFFPFVYAYCNSALALQKLSSTPHQWVDVACSSKTLFTEQPVGQIQLIVSHCVKLKPWEYRTTGLSLWR